MSNKNRLQIISGPRMGSTAFYLYLTQGFHIEIPEQLKKNTEFLNRQLYDDDKEYKTQVIDKLDLISHLDAYVIKGHVNHFFDLGSRNLLDYHKEKTRGFRNIMLMRRDVREKILSQCIAEKSSVWNKYEQPEKVVELKQEDIDFQVRLASLHYHWLINNSFNFDYDAVVYFEDLIDPELRRDITMNVIEPMAEQHFDYDNVTVDISKPTDKRNLIENYDQAIEWLDDAMETHQLSDRLDLDVEHRDTKFLDVDIEKLKKTKHFCAAPWTHLHVLPNGNIQPCCIWDYGVYKNDRTRFGNMNGSNSVEQAMNLDGFRELRRKFLNDEYEEGCKRCYDREKTGATKDASMRQWMNETFLSDSMIYNTRHDGNIKNIELKYVDIRFGNICNLKCRMCGHGLSSTWFDEENAVSEYMGQKPKLTRKFIKVDCYDMIEPYLEHVQEIYFAGGEPMLYPEHLRMLQQLEEMGRFEVKLKYNTNLTTLKYKGVDFVEMWKKFKYVHVGASIDAMGDTVEYIRTKLNWEDFRKNFERVRQEAPHVLLTPSPTIGILNLEKFIEFERFAIENGWYNTRPFGLNYVMEPEYLNIYYLPEWYKQEMIARYQKHIHWCEERGVEGYNIKKIEELITRLREPQDPEKIKECMRTLEEKLEMWDVTSGGGLYWRSQLPHIVRLIEKNKRMNA